MSVLHIITTQASEYMWVYFIRVLEAILSLNGSLGQMQPTNNKSVYSWPQATINDLYTDFLFCGGVERMESGLISWKDRFCAADTDT